MFGDLLNVRIKAAEKALRDGRMDEAFRLVSAADLRIQSRGAAILTALTPLFIARAREHFRAERVAEALADLDRAGAADGGGIHAAEIAELRGHVQAVAIELQRQHQVQRGRLEEARQRMEMGSLIAGHRVLADAGRDADVDRLREQIVRRSDDAVQAASEAQTMMTAGQWAAAAERVRRAKSHDPNHEAVVQIEARLCRAVLQRARQALLEGRIMRAADELKCLANLGDELPEKRELTHGTEIAARAARCVAHGQYGEARRLAMGLGRELTGAGWLDEIIGQLKSVEDIQTTLLAGPLGMSGLDPVRGGNRIASQLEAGLAPQRSPVRFVSDETILVPVRRSSASGIPDRLLLIVDGGGSYLLLRGTTASVGRAACDDPAEIALLSDIGERHATISRMEEDYFLLAARDVEVAGQMTRHRLLRDGDRLVLGKKAKMTFHLPSKCSASAVLALSDTTKMPQDVRRVVLLSQHATIGNGPTSHIQCRHAATQLVLFERDGQLWLRNRNDGHVDAGAHHLTLGEPIEVGGVRVVLNAWNPRTTVV